MPRYVREKLSRQADERHIAWGEYIRLLMRRALNVNIQQLPPPETGGKWYFGTVFVVPEDYEALQVKATRKYYGAALWRLLLAAAENEP